MYSAVVPSVRDAEQAVGEAPPSPPQRGGIERVSLMLLW